MNLFHPDNLTTLASIYFDAEDKEVLSSDASHSEGGRTCEHFAEEGFCDLEDGSWYRHNCKRSCGLCRDNGHEAGETSDTPPSSSSSSSSSSSAAFTFPAENTASTDCPLLGRVSARISKPLHLRRSGTWSAVVMLTHGGFKKQALLAPAPTTCVSVVFKVSLAPQLPENDNVESNSTRTPDTDNAEDLGRQSPAPSSKSRGPTNADARFERYSTGQICRDGADILEGPLDKFTDCDEATKLCKKTRKCSEKCKRNKSCFFYTTFQDGWCQLSSRCEDQVAASDRSAQTYARVDI